MPDIIPNLHPMFVHFPIALIAVSAAFHVAAIAVRGKACATHCAILAHTTLWLGALAALPTAIFGWHAFNSVNHDEAGHVAMLAHRGWALATLAVLVVLAGWDAWRSKVDAVPAWRFAGAVIVASGMVAVTAWHGAELVYRHGLGVLSLPDGESGQGHGHVQGASMGEAGPVQEEAMHAEEGGQEHSHDGHAH